MTQKFRPEVIIFVPLIFHHLSINFRQGSCHVTFYYNHVLEMGSIQLQTSVVSNQLVATKISVRYLRLMVHHVFSAKTI